MKFQWKLNSMQKFKKLIYHLKNNSFLLSRLLNFIVLCRKKNLFRIARNYLGLFFIDYPFFIYRKKLFRLIRSQYKSLSKFYRIILKINYKPEEAINFKNELKQGLKNYEDNISAINDFLVLLPEFFSTKYSFIPLSDLFNFSEGKNNISIRVDIDAYPPSAVDLAKHLSSFNIPATFFFLHSAKYYIKKRKNIFYRNPELNDWLIDIASLGMEIGLHNDALGFSKKINIPPEEILYEEISFIRNLGIDITGTVAHNSFSNHCAENFEVFQELQTFSPPNNSNYYFNYLNKVRKKYQINSVSMTGLGLKYEGNFPCKREISVEDKYIEQILNKSQTGINYLNWMDSYINHNPSFKRKYDCDIWLLPNKKWMISDRIKNRFLHGISLNQIRNYIVSNKLPKTTVITIHPEYVIRKTKDSWN